MPWTALGAAAAAGINYLSQRQANKENSALARLQNQWNLEQWQRENQYNLPTNQVARLKAAGLNPNLVFANGSMMNEAAPSPSMVSGSGMVRPYLLDPLTAAQVANLEAQTRKTDSETDTIQVLRQATLDNLNAQTSNLAKQNENIEDMIRQRVHQNSLTDEQVKNLRREFGLHREMMDLQWDRLNLDKALNEEQIKQIKADVRKTLAEAKVTERELVEMIDTFALRRSGLQKTLDVSDSQIAQAKATAHKLGLDADLISDEAKGHAQIAKEMEGNEFGAWTLFLISDAVRRLGRIIHQ